MSFSRIQLDVRLIFMVGELRRIVRAYRRSAQPMNVAEHSWRVVFIALLLAEAARAVGKEVDLAKVLVMALLHDIHEVLTGDRKPEQKKYMDIKAREALVDMCKGTSLESAALVAWDEFEAKESYEAQLAKDADTLETWFGFQEELEANNGYAATKMSARAAAGEKLFTQEARDLWDEMQKVGAFSWIADFTKGV